MYVLSWILENIKGKYFLRRLVSPIQKVSHLLKLLIWAEIYDEQPFRWTCIEGVMNSLKLVPVVTNNFPRFSKCMSSGEVIIFQGDSSCRVSQEVSNSNTSRVLDPMICYLRPVKDSKVPKSNLLGCSQQSRFESYRELSFRFNKRSQRGATALITKVQGTICDGTQSGKWFRSRLHAEKTAEITQGQRKNCY